MAYQKQQRAESKYEEHVLQAKRVASKNQGGTVIAFTALVLVGDKKGEAGYALGKSKLMNQAIKKAMEKAKANTIKIDVTTGTLPYDILIKQGACKIYLKPAPEGTGLVAGGAVRKVLELIGIKNATAKIIGTRSKAMNVKCLFEELSKLK